jgi:hypothetical protein
MNGRTQPRRKLFSELSRIESDFGSVMYVRIDHNPSRPDLLLADQTVYVAAGAMVDVVACETSSMGLNRVAYTSGLKAQRKVRKGLITYRFQVPEDASAGAAYSVQSLGASDRGAFTFSIRVS